MSELHTYDSYVKYLMAHAQEGQLDDVSRGILKAHAENKRLAERDCNATISLIVPTADDPFNKEECKIVDVGVSDNHYVVERTVVSKTEDALKIAIDEIETNASLYLPAYHNNKDMAIVKKEAQEALDKIKRVLKGKEYG